MARRIPHVEWVDPNGQVFTCPELYVTGVEKHLQKGNENRITARAILQSMGQKVSSGNARHVRHACLFLKRKGIPVVSIRSTTGGYFIAATKSEIEDYVNDQLKFAKAMIVEAINLRRKAKI